MRRMKVLELIWRYFIVFSLLSYIFLNEIEKDVIYMSDLNG